MSVRRKAWIITFLSFTGISVGMELYAAFSGNKDAVPWTDLLAGNLPAWIVVPAALILAAWLPGHFIDAYRRKAAGLPPKPGEKP